MFVIKRSFLLHGTIKFLTFQEKSSTRRASGSWLTLALRSVGDHARDVPAHVLLWTLFSSAAAVCLISCLRSHTRPPAHTHPREQQEEETGVKKKEEAEEEAEEEVKECEEEEDEAEEDEAEEITKRSDESDTEENIESERVKKRK